MELTPDDLPEEVVDGLSEAVDAIVAGPTVEVDPNNDYEDKR